ncbi:glycoside hydrolase 5 family protein [Streptomyces longispororuber]|uniref:glycoside hydrolase 5 family protein n=1 Tax=Streptomyces longispororuber TaxID=68230 RepID=UPI002108CA72|nr:glycosyl hydrolase [Streptomyces longispororuber]MCQ4208741.1 glycosyl hydrolase [Streptomyces longispororuber]
MTALRFGVNYTPRKDWFYSWLEPSWDEIRRDLDGIASLGLDHVRIFPFWPILQPNRTLIRPRALADVRELVRIAGEAGLDASVDVIQGHMSSYDFVPAWLTSWHTTNMFTDAGALQAQAELARALHEAVADLPNYLGLTLGNEVNQFSGDPHPAPMRASSEQAGNWIRTLLDAVPADGRGLRLHAEYDAVWYLDDHPFLPTHAARLGDVTAIHSWIFNGTAQRYGGMSAQSVRHGEYLVELARAFATDVDRPVWLQEIGAPLNCLDASEAPAFCEQAVRHAADSPALWGVTWWCSHDVDRSLADFPELEYSLGLFDADGKVKPIGRAFAAVAEELRGRAAAPDPRREAVVVEVDDDDVPVRRADLAPGGAVFTAWTDLAREGRRPAVVTSATVASAADLAARGVTAVHLPAASGVSAYSAVSDSSALATGSM